MRTKFSLLPLLSAIILATTACAIPFLAGSDEPANPDATPESTIAPTSPGDPTPSVLNSCLQGTG